MQQYIVRRLLLMIPTLFGITIIVFMLTRFTPQDTVDLLVGDIGYQDEALKQQLRDELGLSSSVHIQYVKWMAKVFQGNFGQSYYTGRSVTAELKNRLPVTVELGATALTISIMVGIPIGIISAIRQDSVLDYSTRGLAILLLAVPSFWLAIMVIVYGSRYLHWAPPYQYTTPWADIRNNIAIIATPAIILGLGLSGTKMRFMRAQMLEVLRQDYIRTARAKGLTELAVLVRHAAKNALIPVVTIIGLQLPILIAGSVILENIFLIPGIGRYLVESATRSDYAILQGLTLLVAVAIVVSNLLVDLSYGMLDPRVRLG